MSSGPNGMRSCRGWPFWPPILRLRLPRGVPLCLGLTISLDGGLEELDEFRCKRAIWSWSFWLSTRSWLISFWSWALVCSKANTWERSRSICRTNWDIVTSLSAIDEDISPYPASRQSKIPTQKDFFPASRERLQNNLADQSGHTNGR